MKIDLTMDVGLSFKFNKDLDPIRLGRAMRFPNALIFYRFLSATALCFGVFFPSMFFIFIEVLKQ